MLLAVLLLWVPEAATAAQPPAAMRSGVVQMASHKHKHHKKHHHKKHHRRKHHHKKTK
ncbi:MAG: hypothetical protein ABSF29_12210 [Tepidisphaeraceae bacterium]|jgi:hypothetical protein